eukprot:TRINITY_DN16897_c0_g1_i2.p1 TRINITY_DN16897_c0_g1~~TRINITY_DN16897_c0_g1_i2.p1  ORF type:complete len:447 (-),score=98.59 TRINITY_DN16897_c0_g1_i2:217-1557(-)
MSLFFFQAEDGIRDLVRSRGLGDVYKRQLKVYLLPEGHNIDHEQLDVLRDGDMILLRGGKRIAPKKDERCEGPRRVDVNYKIMSLADVNTVNQSFFCDFLLTCTWFEPTLKGIKLGQVDWDLVFDPQIDIRNAFDIQLMSQPFGSPQSTRLDETTGAVTYIMRFKGILSEPMELEVFPFDHQALHIQVCTQGLGEDRITLYSTVGSMTEVFLPDWEIEPQPTVFSLLTDPGNSIHGARYSELHINVHAKRRESYYIWNVGLIVLAIVSLSFTSFSIPPTEVEGRLTINLTLLLTAMAFKFVIAASLPVVAYLTPLDKYLLANFGFLWIMTCFNGALPHFVGFEPESYDRIAYLVLMSLFILLQIFTVAWCLTARKKGAAFFAELEQREYGDKESYRCTPTMVDDLNLSASTTPREETPREHEEKQVSVPMKAPLSARGEMRQPLLD